MIDPLLFMPILVPLIGALAAAGIGISKGMRSWPATWLSGVGAVFPLASFLWLISCFEALREGAAYTWRFGWMPSLGLDLVLYLDSLSALFAYLITFIGTLIVIYAGQYFKGEEGTWRFFCYLLLFMSSMLGLVLAGDILTLFIFWEGTSVTSYLLVAYKFKDEEAGKGAFKALFITGGGGIALLVGLLLVAHTAGSTEFADILVTGDLIRQNSLYPLILILLGIGAFTKSAQFPFHIWLPGAMSAPTPASAYLHSATMVKAGIYLMARLNPALGGTEPWFWMFTSVGLVTMVSGAYLGLRQNDLKALLAYSTISQLGVMMMMIGQSMEIAFKALIIGVLAHALYKSALFMIAGIVDHETGTRDIRRLGGLGRSMPVCYATAVFASLSMAGLPPLFGFLAKETLLATAIHPSLPVSLAWLLPASTVFSGAFMLAMAAMLVMDVFRNPPGDRSVHGHEAPLLMLMAPLVPTVLSIAIGLLPEAKVEAAFLANAAGDAFGDKVKVSLKMWTGLNVPMLLSVIAVSSGTLLFFYRHRVRALQERYGGGWTLNSVYDAALSKVDRLAYMFTLLQVGRLRVYMTVILIGTLLLVVGFGSISPARHLLDVTGPALDLRGEMVILRVLALLITAGAAVAAVLLMRDFYAILAFAASGLGVAVLLALEPAPDVALVQIVVDILTLVILVLALSRLPKRLRKSVQSISLKVGRIHRLQDALIAGAFGFVVMLLSLAALVSRPRFSTLTPFFEANAKSIVGSRSIVGAIIVDFRGMDTLIEIAVFSIAGLGIYTLFQFAAKKYRNMEFICLDYRPFYTGPLKTMGVGGTRRSPFIRGLAVISLPLAMVIGITHILYGHDQPGDGFTAGVIISIGVGFWYVVYGYEQTRLRLWWLKGSAFIGSGILIAVLSGVLAALITGNFFANVDFGYRIGLHLPDRIHVSTSLLFEIAICLSVIGGVTHMLNALGRPEECGE